VESLEATLAGRRREAEAAEEDRDALKARLEQAAGATRHLTAQLARAKVPFLLLVVFGSSDLEVCNNFNPQIFR